MDEAQLKLPPFNVEAEQSVIGGLLLDNSAFDSVVGVVSEADFYTRDHRIIFREISKILTKNQPADIVTLAEQLDSVKLLEEAGGFAYLGALAQNTPTAANIVRYAEIVRDKSLIRSMLIISGEISNKTYNPEGMDAKAILDFAQSRWMAVGEHLSKANNTLHHVGVVMDSVLANIDKLLSNPNKDDVTGLRSGLIDLDKMTTGFQPGELTILAARPSMGKTSLALNIVENMALKEKKNVAFFSLEMINDQLGMRLLSSVARINQQRVKVARLNEDELGKLSLAGETLRESGIYLDEQSGLDVNELRARARRLHRECVGGLHAIMIDYLQLMKLPDIANKADAIGVITVALKNLAKELHLPVICLSQLNRGLEQRPNKRPVMSDLRDSGAIEQDADLILFIYRDVVYNADSMDKNIAEVIVAKQRNGPIGTVYGTFIQHLMRFENMAMGAQVPSIEFRQQKKSGGNFRAKNSYEDKEDGVDI